jgi:hypothetical protein
MRIGILLLTILLAAAIPLHAQVTVERHGQENPVVEIAKATFWGGAAGLVLGLAVALVAEENEENIVKWFFVGGVFGGFAYGIYHVATRPEPSSALLEFDEDGVNWNFPTVALQPGFVGERKDTHGAVTLLSVGF